MSYPKMSYPIAKKPRRARYPKYGGPEGGRPKTGLKPLLPPREGRQYLRSSIPSPQEDSLSPAKTNRLREQGWDYRNGAWHPPRDKSRMKHHPKFGY